MEKEIVDPADVTKLINQRIIDLRKAIESKIFEKNINFQNTKFIEIDNQMIEMTEKEFIFENERHLQKIENALNQPSTSSIISKS